MNHLKQFLDTQLNRLTMYHVVVMGLSGIAVAAAALMLSGYLPYSMPLFLVSVALFTGASYASNWLFGWLFGVRPHSESAVITGLILALLFSPPVSFIAAVKIVLVAMIAMASKYILAYRGKHIFNPAAVAIVIASVGGLAYATWWIATPALLVITSLVALLILYKTQKLRMGAVFLLVAGGLLLLQMALGGNTSWQAISATLLSWPLVFFAGVMLSEPQTLPPRRRQQYMIAIIVAVLMVISFHYSSLIMTPALALIIGNAVAFYIGIRQGVSLRLVSKKQIGVDGYELTFDTKPLAFEPGQYVELTLPHRHADMRGLRRVFTIIGRPNDTQLSIATRIPKRQSSFKRALTSLKTGQTIHGARIAGDFVLPRDTTAPVVFIAGGIGVTPLVSFLRDKDKRSITLIYVVSSIADLMFVDELRRYEVRVVVVTRDSAPLPDTEWQHEPDRLTEETLQKYIDVSKQPHVYISGPPMMVNQVKRYAKALGSKNIKTDHFTGY